MIERGKHQKMFVVRHNVSVGEKNGYLKGNKNEKIEGWLGFLKDNMDSTQLTIQYMIDNGTLEVDGVEYLKGRDIKSSWMIIDEAEDLTEEQFKMIGERASDGSVICFVGDVEQVTQNLYKTNSGLSRAINKLKGNPLVGVVVFDDNENDNVRSDVSRVFTTVY
jgi:predicted ribonuclease YlaK